MFHIDGAKKLEATPIVHGGLMYISNTNEMYALDARNGRRAGVLVEYGDTEQMFTRPADPRTSDYVTGRFG